MRVRTTITSRVGFCFLGVVGRTAPTTGVDHMVLGNTQPVWLKSESATFAAFPYDPPAYTGTLQTPAHPVNKQNA
jgi:hypothetical protein